MALPKLAAGALAAPVGLGKLGLSAAGSMIKSAVQPFTPRGLLGGIHSNLGVNLSPIGSAFGAIKDAYSDLSGEKKDKKSKKIKKNEDKAEKAAELKGGDTNAGEKAEKENKKNVEEKEWKRDVIKKLDTTNKTLEKIKLIFEKDKKKIGGKEEGGGLLDKLKGMLGSLPSALGMLASGLAALKGLGSILGGALGAAGRLAVAGLGAAGRGVVSVGRMAATGLAAAAPKVMSGLRAAGAGVMKAGRFVGGKVAAGLGAIATAGPVKSILEKVTGKAATETGEKVAAKAATEAGEKGAQKLAVEAGEKGAQKLAVEGGEKVAEKAAGAVAKDVGKEAVEKGAQKLAVEGGEKVAEKAAGAVAKDVGKEAVEKGAAKGIRGKIAAAIAKRLPKALGGAALKQVPVLGAIIAGGFAISKLMDGDTTGAALAAAEGIPVAGIPAAITGVARDVYNDVYATPEDRFPFDTDLKNNPAIFKQRNGEIVDQVKQAADELMGNSAKVAEGAPPATTQPPQTESGQTSSGQAASASVAPSTGSAAPQYELKAADGVGSPVITNNGKLVPNAGAPAGITPQTRNVDQLSTVTGSTQPPVVVNNINNNSVSGGGGNGAGNVSTAAPSIGYRNPADIGSYAAPAFSIG
jgi:hypothetical protein